MKPTIWVSSSNYLPGTEVNHDDHQYLAKCILQATTAAW